MSQFYFIGNHSEFLGRKLARLGESMDLDSDQFKQALEDHVPLLPRDEFGRFFSAEEVAKFDTPAKRLRAPAEVLNKWVAALKRYAELQAGPPELAEVKEDHDATV